MANTFTLINSASVGSGGTANIEFTSIPSTYTDLVLKISSRTTRTNYNYSELIIQVNGITTSGNYYSTILLGNNGSTAGFSVSYAQLNYISTSKTTASTFASTEVYIPNYTSSNAKSMSIDGSAEVNSADNAMGLNAAVSNNTGAITSIKLFPPTGEAVNFTQYTTAYLYGIKKN